MTIPEPRFYLRNKNSITETSIVMQVKFNKERIYLTAVEKINPKDWDEHKQRAIVSKRNLASTDINIWLDKMSIEFKNIYRHLLYTHSPLSANHISRILQENLNLVQVAKVEVVIKSKTLFEFIDQFINESVASKSISTIKTYKSTFRRLKEFAQTTGKELDFQDITHEFRRNFLKYLQSIGSGKNTEGKHIKEIKVFMNEAAERKLHNNMDFRSKSFSKPIEDANKIFLTMDEIQKLVDLDLSNNKMKDVVRDYFIISAMTSLRFSDFIDIKEENIKDDTIQIVTKKTGEKVVIPISKWVGEIFLKYNFNLPKAPCNQVFNRVLKDVGEDAGLDETITISKTVGGIKQTLVYKKFELLTAHTGRRSMISNCILAGIATPQIMLMSAHRSLRVFQSYVRIDQVQNAEKLASHSFFNN